MLLNVQLTFFKENPVPPWVGYNEEKEMKSQILALSSVSKYSVWFQLC